MMLAILFSKSLKRDGLSDIISSWGTFFSSSSGSAYSTAAVPNPSAAPAAPRADII